MVYGVRIKRTPYFLSLFLYKAFTAGTVLTYASAAYVNFGKGAVAPLLVPFTVFDVARNADIHNVHLLPPYLPILSKILCFIHKTDPLIKAGL